MWLCVLTDAILKPLFEGGALSETLNDILVQVGLIKVSVFHTYTEVIYGDRVVTRVTKLLPTSNLIKNLNELF